MNYGYIRVSTDDQTISIDAQRRAIEKYAIGLVEFFVDRGVSGSKPALEREGMAGLLGAIAAGDRVIIAKWDRLARDVMIDAMIARLVEKAGASLECVDGTGAGSDPQAQLMRTIIAAFAQYELQLIRFRTKAALAEKKARGEAITHAPFGFVAIPTNRTNPKTGKVIKVLKPNEAEQVTIRRIVELDANGIGAGRIASMLSQEGHRPRGKSWHRTTVRRILQASQQ